MTESPMAPTSSIHAVPRLDRKSVFWMIMKRRDGTLFPMEFKFRKFNKRTNACEWSRFGTSIQDSPMRSTIDYVEANSFPSVHDAHKAISLRMDRKD